MEDLSRAALIHQFQCIIARHLGEVRRFVSFAPPVEQQISDDLFASVEHLRRMCESELTVSEFTSREEVRRCLATIDRFLQQMNQPLDVEFRESQLGQIWLRAHEWLGKAIRGALTIRDVRRLLAPSAPDVLVDLGNGLYEARWWRPVPMMDVEILKRTEQVELHGEPFEPSNLPNGLAVQFSVSTDDSVDGTG
jgi:hypothetical protein